MHGLSYIIAVVAGALVGILGQQLYLWREHRRRFDEARHLAYERLLEQAFRTQNEFAATLSPSMILVEHRRYVDLLNDVTGAIASARLLASVPVQAAVVELGDALTEVVEFASGVLADDAPSGILGLFLSGAKPMPVAQHPGLKEHVGGLDAATTGFVTAAQKEMRVPGRRRRLARHKEGYRHECSSGNARSR